MVEPSWPNAHGCFDPQVHMGTHMWTNGASRRGRRMSLDLPPLPITPKDSEFLQRRPDLFYPYLPAPFLNGVQQKVSGCVSLKISRAVSSITFNPINFIFISFIYFLFIREFETFNWVKLIHARKIALLSNFDSRKSKIIISWQTTMKHRFYKFWDIEISIQRISEFDYIFLFILYIR